MKRCNGCNVCNQYRVARVPLAPRQVAYLRSSGVIDAYNQHAAEPMGISKARLHARSLVLSKPCELGRLIRYVPQADFARLEVKGIITAALLFLEKSVFTFPMTSLDLEALNGLKADIVSRPTQVT